MMSGLPHSEAGVAFCAHLVRENSRVYFSQILRLEIAEAVRKLAHRQHLPEDLRHAYQLRDWATDPHVRERWMSFGMGQFATFIGKFSRVAEFPFGIRLWHQSVRLMGTYALG